MNVAISKIVRMNPYVYGKGSYFGELRYRLKKKQRELSKILKLDLSCIVDGEGNKSGIALIHFIKLGSLVGTSEKDIIKKLKFAKIRFGNSSSFFCLNDYGASFNEIKITRKKFEIDIWKTDFRVIVLDSIISKIKQEVNRLGGPFLMFNIIDLTPTIYYRLCSKKGIEINNYYKLIRFLGIDLLEAERGILRVTYFGCNKEYKFIKEVTPLIFRVACHIIGDGSNPSGNTFRWIQKNKNSGNMIGLIEKITGTSPRTIKLKNGDCNYITIDAYFSKLLKYGMNIDLKKIKTADTIRSFLNLPKDYLIQFLAAIVVDEGCIRWKNARSLIISQSKEDFLIELVRILDLLGYEHSNIKKDISKSSIEKYGNYTMYRINIYAEGVIKFYNDLQEATLEQGYLAGLWHKQEGLYNYIKTLRNNILPENCNIEHRKNLLGLAVVNIAY